MNKLFFIILILFVSCELPPRKLESRTRICETATGIIETKYQKHFDNSKNSYRYNIILGRWELVHRSNTGVQNIVVFKDGKTQIVSDQEFYTLEKGDTLTYQTGVCYYE